MQTATPARKRLRLPCSSRPNAGQREPSTRSASPPGPAAGHRPGRDNVPGISLHSAALAAADLADRIRKRRASELIDRARQQTAR